MAAFFHSGLKRDVTQINVSTHAWVNKNVAYLHNGILFSSQSKTLTHFPIWMTLKKLYQVREARPNPLPTPILYDSIYMKHPEKDKSTETESILVIAKDWKREWGTTAVGHRFLQGWWNCFKMRWWWCLHSSENLPIIESSTLNEWVLWCGNYTSIKLLKRTTPQPTSRLLVWRTFLEGSDGWCSWDMGLIQH